MHKYFILFLFIFASVTFAQVTSFHTGPMSVGTKAIDAVVQLQVNSTTKGFLPPRMTEAQRDAIAAAPSGMLIYNTTSGSLDLFTGGLWVPNVGGGINPWITATDYKIGNIAHESTQIYLALTDHTSGTFATDLGNNDWIELSSMDFTKPVNGVNAVANGGTNSAAALASSLVMESVGGAIVESLTTSTELSYLNNVSSDLQTQLDAKLDDYTSTTDNALIRSDGTAGAAVQDSGVIVSDLDAITGITALTVDNLLLDLNTLSSSSGAIVLDPFNGVVQLPDLTASTPLKLDASSNIIAADIDLTTDVTGILPEANGGTGADSSSAANGVLLIGNGAGFSAATLTGTADQVVVVNGAGTVTLSTPQNINTTSTPTFGNLTLGVTESRLSIASNLFTIESLIEADDIIVKSSNATTTTISGDASFETGSTTGTVSTGDVFLRSGAITNATNPNPSGSVNISSGSTNGNTVGPTGGLLLRTGNVTQALSVGVSGSVTIYSGTTVDGNSGGVFIGSGLVSGSGNRGTMTLTSAIDGALLDTQPTGGTDLAIATTKYVNDNAGVIPLTTKGDIFTYTTVDARLPVGTNDDVLVADSAEATGLRWASDRVTTPSASGVVSYSARVAGGGAVTLELGNFISGSCTNANPQVCTFSTTFSQVPNCWMNSENQLNFCGAVTTTTTTVSIYCTSHGGTLSQANLTNKGVFCNGLQ